MARVSVRPQQQLKRVEQKKTLKVVYEAMHAAKREDVKLERKIKEDNLQMVRSLKTYEVERAKQAREAIRNHQLAVSARFEKQRQAHQEFLAQDFINMIAAEDKRREDIEREIAAMEQDERKHIERLRALQEEQRAAYDALESALAS